MEKNEEAAVSLWQDSAHSGDPEGQHNLAVCHFFGDGVTKDRFEAAHLWQLAADQQHPNALHWLGICYLYGHGVPRDVDRSRTLLQAAADRGVTAAAELINKTGTG